MFKNVNTKEEEFTPVNELLNQAASAEYIQALDAMWEGWLTNETTDTANAQERAKMLYLYKGLRKFLKTLG